MSGEFQKIDLFIRAFVEAGGSVRGQGVTVGPGDDCALIGPDGRPLAVTTDTQIDGVHFRRAWAPPESIGHKALAVNLSDLAAAAARAGPFLCALGLPPDLDDLSLQRIASGMGRLAHRTGAVLAGGNISRSPVLSLTLTAMGPLVGPWIGRAGASVGDHIVVVGRLGGAAALLRTLEQPSDPTPEPAADNPLLWPEPLLAAAEWLAPHASTLIDVSDGLLQDLGHIARHSKVELVVHAQRLPIHPAARLLLRDPLEQLRCAASGGEDYALAATLPDDALHSLRRQAPDLDLTVVGHVSREHPAGNVRCDDLPPDTRLRGFDHFA